ncbi:MAG: hypothetical protein AMS21_01220 [Gemmatimonas sp. SG8_38_2]|nr:MAG: hypothetical protein AMS21_01220 [Gemmatimonas sp. SG8_38_2]
MRFHKEPFEKNDKETRTRFRAALIRDFENALESFPLDEAEFIEGFEVRVKFKDPALTGMFQMEGTVTVYAIPKEEIKRRAWQKVECETYKFTVRPDRKYLGRPISMQPLGPPEKWGEWVIDSLRKEAGWQGS